MVFVRKLEKRYVALLIIVLLSIPLSLMGQSTARAASSLQHYLYVFPDGGIDVYDIDNGYKLVKQINLPVFSGGRGSVVDAASHALYLSYHGDGGDHGNGSLLKYDLLTDTIMWQKDYPFGIDSMAITPDGQTIYMPDGEHGRDSTWHTLNASDGSVKESIVVDSGLAAHNTIVSLDGSHVYFGALNADYLYEYATATNTLVKKIGPLLKGVRPFTINGNETLAFTTAAGVLGFQVSSITSGQVLYTVGVDGFTAPDDAQAPSHGISLSPDEKELYLIDTANSYVHVYDISGLPDTTPEKVADIPLRKMEGTETPCLYDCTHEGWLLHSRDGRYVWVGDSGDVIDTVQRKSIMNLNTLFNTRKYLEIDYSNGVPVFSTQRFGLGYDTSGSSDD